MRDLQPLPSLSVVLEWETGEESGGERARDCLRELNRQMAASGHLFPVPPELVLVHDPFAAARSSAMEAAAGLAWPGRLEIAEPPQALSYYEKKNFGFARTRGDVVAFVDSDLALEPEWLAAIAGPFTDARNSVVVGRTHFETRTLYERATALFWIFDERVAEDEVRPTLRLVSNNIAFRRALFAALPFPPGETYRGQCSELGAMLARLGVRLHEATAARAAHPAPAGVRAFAARAAHAGDDTAAYAHARGWASRREVLLEWRHDIATMRRRIAARAPAIGAGAGTRTAALALGLTYYSIKAAAYLAGAVRRRGRVPSPAGPAASGL